MASDMLDYQHEILRDDRQYVNRIGSLNMAGIPPGTQPVSADPGFRRHCQSPGSLFLFFPGNCGSRRGADGCVFVFAVISSQADVDGGVAELLKPVVFDLDITRVAVAVVPARMNPVRYRCMTVVDVPKGVHAVVEMVVTGID